MFETKDHLQEIHGKLMAFVATRTRGDILTNADIAAVSGLTVDGESWRYAIRHLQKRVLKEHGIALWSIEAGSYKLLTNREQVHHCSLKRQQRMFRQSTRAKREVESVDPLQLSDHDRQLRIAALNHLRSQRREINRGVRMVKRSEVNPIRKIRPQPT
jgi:hypothetical protein